ncbi:hypothetical protein BpHYR1_002261 [Brachionus plicatilis]|uniref:Uncharacterized protein n=1 Tax=Brachionus plicatilis TaxID=10195 RepID=A0A3M7SMA5_BRAPC|nr:hypothetical protein BpHYR1_002261 [Brachionus plicatilis]
MIHNSCLFKVSILLNFQTKITGHFSLWSIKNKFSSLKNKDLVIDDSKVEIPKRFAIHKNNSIFLFLLKNFKIEIVSLFFVNKKLKK